MLRDGHQGLRMGETDDYSKVLFEHPEKGYQYRLTVSTFREVQYVHLRKYFQSYEGDWMPTKEGASIPATIQNTFSLIDGLIEILSYEESVDVITEHFQSRINDLKLRAKPAIIDL